MLKLENICGALSGRGGGGHSSVRDPALLPGPGMASRAGCGAKGVAEGRCMLVGLEVSTPVPCLCTPTPAQEGREGKGRSGGGGRLNHQSPYGESMTESIVAGASASHLGNGA